MKNQLVEDIQESMARWHGDYDTDLSLAEWVARDLRTAPHAAQTVTLASDTWQPTSPYVIPAEGPGWAW